MYEWKYHNDPPPYIAQLICTDKIGKREIHNIHWGWGVFKNKQQSVVVYSSNPSYSGGRDRRILRSRQVQAKLERPYLRSKNTSRVLDHNFYFPSPLLSVSCCT
jgi:hypothetical protein